MCIRDSADTEGFRTRVNYHYRLLDDAKPGKYYIAVFNNNVYLQEKATYDVEVTVALPGVPGVLPADPPLCPADCYAPERGECAADTTPSGSMSASREGVCECKPGYGGDMCEGLMISSSVDGGTAAGILNPGGWAYVKFDVDAAAAMRATSRHRHDRCLSDTRTDAVRNGSKSNKKRPPASCDGDAVARTSSSSSAS